MTNFDKHKRLLNKELDQFNSILGEILPRYVALMKKSDSNEAELKELGEIEHFLIEVNAKIATIKNKLDQDLFGETMDLYYQVKKKASTGDLQAKEHLSKLRSSLRDSIQGDTFFNWN